MKENDGETLGREFLRLKDGVGCSEEDVEGYSRI